MRFSIEKENGIAILAVLSIMQDENKSISWKFSKLTLNAV
jgi:hypothetical protein